LSCLHQNRMDSTIERADEDQGGTVRILPHGTTAAPAGPLADGTSLF
jgi:hypothetical protein